jgi:hypothetical protein
MAFFVLVVILVLTSPVVAIVNGAEPQMGVEPLAYQRRRLSRFSTTRVKYFKQLEDLAENMQALADKFCKQPEK